MGNEMFCLHQLFRQQAERTPGAVAVVDGDIRWTYRELDQKTDSLAGHLQERGMVADSIGGIFMDKCADYILAYIGILKAGGGYLPLELTYPTRLLKKITNDARPVVVVTKSRYAGKLEANALAVLEVDGDRSWEGHGYDRAAGDVIGLDHLAYVVYSSGTTGEPKGISSPHRGSVHSYRRRHEFHPYRVGARVACNVFFVWELLRPLLRGGTVYPIPDDVIYDPVRLLGFVESNRITEILFTPSLFDATMSAVPKEEFQARMESVDTVWLNGEVVGVTLKERAVEALPPRTQLLNTYSISECHDVSHEDLRKTEETGSGICLVGRPIPDVAARILTDTREGVSEGQIGNLWIGGPGLARGYLNNPELTAEHFVEIKGERLYHTGDLAVMRDNGKLEIKGRSDGMVRIRGNTVDLRSVEVALTLNANIKSCAVVVIDDEGKEKRLAAYVVREELADWAIDARTGASPQIRKLLKPHVAPFMIPSLFVEIDQIPVHNTTGKLDREKLPSPPATVEYEQRPIELSEDESVAEREQAMCALWEQVLMLAPGSIQRDADFFDFGGHSLLAVELVTAIEAVFGVQLMVKDVFEQGTVAALVTSLTAEGDGEPDLGLPREAALAQEIVPEGPAKPRSLGEASSVFLTGATGFLGAFMLDELLRQTGPNVRGFCLVRADGGNSGDGMNRIIGNLQTYRIWKPEYESRIEPVIGDLGEPLFGLSEAQFDHYARRIDFIFHCGALVNYVYPYSVLKPSMVNGTHEILRLACRNGAKPLHYISTNGIFPGGDETPYREDDRIDGYADRLAGGYGPAKWVAEKLVWEAQARGLAACVYRPGNIGHHSQTGSANPNDFQFMIIDACKKIGCAPHQPDWAMEMTAVDFLVRSVVAFAKDPGHLGRVYNVVQTAPTPATWIFDLLAQRKEIERTVAMEEWQALLRETGETDGDKLLQVLSQSLADVEMYLRDSSIYDCSGFDRAVAKNNDRRPATDAAYFEKLLERHRDSQ